MRPNPGAPAKTRALSPLRRMGAGLLILLVAGALSAWWWNRHPIIPGYQERPRGTLSFNQDIAPLIFTRCAPCHRPGQPAPFSLLTLEDVKRRSRQIAELTRMRSMPPWLAEPGYGDFANSRRLGDEELGVLQQWLREGCREGSDVALPAPPQWSEGWALGTPDIVVTLPQPFLLGPEGPDVYRNFVFPVAVDTPRYVRAVELNPGNRRVLHHALIKVDRTAQARNLDAQDPEPGFVGMRSGAEMPGGHFLTWQPGRVAAPLPDGLSWRLEPGSDLVLETHLNRSGKPEPFQPSIGLYFTDQPPTNACFKMALTSRLIDIPAGQRDYPVRDSFTLPADVELLAVLPHAHYLGREVRCWATSPGGQTQWLIRITRWDFNWQSDYRYARPLFLPKGTTLQMEFTFDNSAGNPRNPHHPPQRVRYGPQSQDEMAEVWLQLLPRREADRARLAQAYETKVHRMFCDAAEYALRLDPQDTRARLDLGIHYSALNRLEEANDQLLAATRLQPTNDEPHYLLGIVHRRQHRLDQARAEFERALQLNPGNAKAHGNLGFISEEQGQWQEAERHYQVALQLNPYDELVRESLEELRRAHPRQATP